MHACDTACLSQSASKSHSAQPVGLPQTKHSSSGTSGLLSFFSCAGASHFTCLIALLPFDHNARSPCGISFPHSAHLPLNSLRVGSIRSFSLRLLDLFCY